MKLYRKIKGVTFDSVLIGLTGITACVMAYLLFFHDFNTTRTITTENVGYVKPYGPDIRVRGEKDQSWNKVASHTNVFRNDRVFTGENSQAKIKLKTDDQFLLEPNSLIVISDSKENQTFEFSMGGFVANLRKGAKFVVKFNSKETEITSEQQTTLRLSSKDGISLNLVVFRGEAEVKRPDLETTEKVIANQELEISKKDSKPRLATISLLFPNPGMDHWSKDTVVNFEWKKSEHTPSVLEISPEPDFSKNVIAVQVVTDKKTVQLPRYGIYFWRLVDSENTDSRSVVSSFSIHELPLEDFSGRTIAEAPMSAPQVILQEMEPPKKEKVANSPSEIEVKPSVEPAASVPSPLIVPKESETKESKTEIINFKSPGFWMWIGSGMNFQYYRQTIPNIEGQTLFQKVQGPTATVRAGFQGETFGVDATYEDVPGKIESSDSLIVNDGNYHWRILTLDGLYRMRNHWTFRLGVQHHSMPFMLLDPLTSTMVVPANTMTLLTVGLDKTYPISDRLRAEAMVHYQYPFLTGSASGTPFTVNPKLAFDGSIGGVYSLTKAARLGLYWHGQWHQFDFSYGSGTSSFNGAQTLFYSNVELRFGFEF